MKAITGHLTQTNIKHINIMFDKGLTNCKLNRISYYIKPLQENEFLVKMCQASKEYKSGFYYSQATFKTNKNLKNDN